MPNQNTSDLITVTNIFKSFQVGEQTIEILKDVSMTVHYGDFTVIVGPSGCGKSTLLHIVLGLEVPNSGDVIFLGENLYNNTHEDYRSGFRKKHIGMIYQQPNWVKSMNVIENVAFPLMLLGMDKDSALSRAHTLLTQIKMDKWELYAPTELSGGQQQRVALARALANNPEIIIADEPTGNLDFQSGQEVMLLLEKMNKEEQKTIVMVTHDLEYLKYAKSAVQIFDGKVQNNYQGNDVQEFLKTLNLKRGQESANPPQSPPVSEVPNTEPQPAPPSGIRVIKHPTSA